MDDLSGKRVKVLMYVYGNIQTDARVKRAAKALADKFSVVLLSTDYGIEIKDCEYKNVFLKCPTSGFKGYIRSVWEALRIIRIDSPDIFYAHDYFSALLVRFVLFFRPKIKVVYDAHELIISEANKGDARMMFFYKQEKAIINKVNLVVCASKERAVLMKNHYRLEQLPLVIENRSFLSLGYDLSELKVYPKLQKFFANPAPTIVYAGVIVSSRKLDLLIDFVAKLAPKYKILFVGEGGALNSLKLRAANYSSLESCFTGAVPYEALGSLLSKCDIGYLFYPTDSLNNIYCASNKIFEYASVSLPILANNNPTVKRILEDNSIGVASDNFRVALDKLFASLAQIKGSCQAFIRRNSWETAASLLVNRVSSL